jgi:hypothetical protein
LFRIPWGGRLGRGNDDREREGVRRDEVAGLDFGPVRGASHAISHNSGELCQVIAVLASPDAQIRAIK